MADERYTGLEPSAPETDAQQPARPSFETVNQLAELVLDLIEPTGLVPLDGLSRLRGQVGKGSLAHALHDAGLASDEGVARVLADRYHLSFVDIVSQEIAPDAVEQIPMSVLQRVNALPYRLVGNTLHVAIVDPADVVSIDELRLASRYTVELAIAPREDLLNELHRFARGGPTLEARVDAEIRAIEQAEDEDLAETTADDLEADDGISDAPLVRLVNALIFQAAEDGASDVHVEPQEDCLMVRYRIDGVLQEVQRIPKRLSNGVTTRLKVLAKLDIAERRRPQDGRISLNAAAAGRVLDIRVATLPTVEGESVVMRLLDKSRRAPTLEELGLSREMQRQLAEIVHRPTGALMVTGPTGSGKTTTLYAALAELNRPEINIITVEDPVEYRLAGVNQVQINHRAGLNFAAALRSILRSDPDVVMVGEIRDVETAKISIEAALTGHFVLSTLHTNDAPSALTRLNEMGVEPFLTGAAVTGVLAQRLARRLCEHCKELYTPNKEELFAARIPEELRHGKVELFRRNGCVRCRQTGYSGRIGVFQLLSMNEELSALAARKASHEELERAAMNGGMTTLWADGIEKVVAGLTSLEELARVTTL
jgi:type IV pilus assembly protein PilB